MTKKHLLFALIVCMSTVWQFLELLLHQEQYDDIEEFLDDVSDWLSDEYGWCHFGFETETDVGGIIKCDTLPE